MTSAANAPCRIPTGSEAPGSLPVPSLTQMTVGDKQIDGESGP